MYDFTSHNNLDHRDLKYKSYSIYSNMQKKVLKNDLNKV